MFGVVQQSVTHLYYINLIIVYRGSDFYVKKIYAAGFFFKLLFVEFEKKWIQPDGQLQTHI